MQSTEKVPGISPNTVCLLLLLFNGSVTIVVVDIPIIIISH